MELNSTPSHFLYTFVMLPTALIEFLGDNNFYRMNVTKECLQIKKLESVLWFKTDGILCARGLRQRNFLQVVGH